MPHRARTALGLLLSAAAACIAPRCLGAAQSAAPPQRQKIKCESISNQEAMCPAPVGGNVRVARQISLTPCVEGENYRVNKEGITVWGGCRADFEFDVAGAAPPSPETPPVKATASEWTPIQKDYYESGYRLGRDDGQAGLSRTHDRYRENEYDARFEKYFSRGYYDGYDRRAKSYSFSSAPAPASGAPATPAAAPPAPAAESALWNVAQRSAYDRGFQRGAEDYRGSRPGNFRRHEADFTEETMRYFRAGYQDGYFNRPKEYRFGRDTDSAGGAAPEAPAPAASTSKWSVLQREAYDRGYNYGARDARTGRDSNFRRFADEYSAATEAYFREGYLDGFHDRPKEYWLAGETSAGEDVTVLCESKENERVTCKTDRFGSIRLKRQLSRADCKENETWGIYESDGWRGVWVDKGCRAEFEITLVKQ